MAVNATAACHLADGAQALFEGWLVELADHEIDLELSTDDKPLMSADVVFACGLLTVDAIETGEPRRVVAAPIFPGETEPVYRSVIIARNDEPHDRLAEGLCVAVNEYDSWSGWNGLDEHRRRLSLEPEVLTHHILTGGHAQSIAAVLHGRADIASIDNTVWNDRTAAEDAQLAVIGTTRDWPAPPISIRSTLPEATQAALEAALLALRDLVPATNEDYTFMLASRDLTAADHLIGVAHDE